MILLVLIYVSAAFCFGDCPAECKCTMEQNLRKASCVNQKLTNIEADIPSDVQFLDLSHNLISKLENSGFQDLKLNKLIKLNVSSNMLSHIALRAFAGLENLQVIDLSKNALQILLPEIFETNVNLRIAYLCSNKFYSLKEQPFLESESLQVLDIRGCLISHIYKNTFSKLPNLIDLDIGANLLTDLDINVIQNLSKLKTIKSDNNTWICNDKLKELTQFLKKKGVKFNSPCEIVEKSQKMIVIEETTESKQQDSWIYNNCDIETGTQTNETIHKICIKSCHFKSDYILLSVVIFVSGSLFGIIITCTFMKSFVKTKTEINRNDECLLTDNNIAMGLSTPVLNRVQYISNHRRITNNLY